MADVPLVIDLVADNVFWRTNTQLLLKLLVNDDLSVIWFLVQ